MKTSFQKNRIALFAGFFCAASVGASGAVVELTGNGDFETGDLSSWDYFPTASSTFAVTGDAFAGGFAGEVANSASASAALIKQSNLGVGVVNPGDTITITFVAKGTDAVGGVQFAEFFSEISGGGVSQAEILGGAPLFLTSTFETYSFTTTAGADVSGGVTLQFGAITGAAIGSEASFIIDNVSVTVDVIPEPSAAMLCVLPLLGLFGRRRRSA